MTDAIAHRGPDGEGHWIEDGVALGHRRLAIIDLSAGGNQPMISHDQRFVLTYNGELYNYRGLRVELEACGHRFASKSDTEVLLAALVEWGEGAVDRLEGMFAFGLWDRRERRITLVRDRTGVKPLYYVRARDALVFASELKGVLAAGVIRPTIDPASFHSFLAAGYVDPDRSIIEGVRQVPPGSLVVAGPEGTSIRRYWEPSRSGTLRAMGEARTQLLERLVEVSGSIAISDVPVGLTLSSGIDSSILALLFRGRSFSAFTAQFGDPTYDETVIAKQIAELAGHDWTSVDATPPDVIEDFRAVAIAGDGELADSSALAHYAVSRSLRSRVSVALSGDGADEFFGGYLTVSASRLATILAPFASRVASKTLASLLFWLAAGDERRVPVTTVAARFFAGLGARRVAHHVEWRRLAPDVRLESLFGPAMLEQVGVDPLRAYSAQFTDAPGSTLDKSLLADQLHYLPGDMLTKVDRMSMAHGLEMRVPFLERSVVELAGEMHGSLLVGRLGPTKKVLREVAVALGLPGGIASRPKRGFNVPAAALLRAGLRPLAENYLDRNADIFFPHLDPDKIRVLWSDHVSRRADHGYLIWALLVHAVWRDRSSVAS